MRGSRLAAAHTALALAFALAACGKGGGAATAKLAPAQRKEVGINGADFQPIAAKPGGYDPEAVKVQVLLDRARFSPGVIDGQASDNLKRAIFAYEQANGMPGDGTLTKEVWTRLTMADPRPAVIPHAVDADDVAGPFTPDIPKDFPGMARLERLGYRSPAEELAESFHMSVDLLTALNPGADFRPGSAVLVADRGGDDLGADLGRIEIDHAQGVVRAYGVMGKLLAVYPASLGSKSCPPLAAPLQVKAILAQPTYSYDSDSVSDLGVARGRSEIAAGPNNPIGVVWIDLSRDGYGIHGAPDPAEVGKAAARGCVRLTNWDARELARGVKPGTPVVFK